MSAPAMSARRALVQGEATNDPKGYKPRGTVAWVEHVEAWEAYHRQHDGQRCGGGVRLAQAACGAQ